MFSYPDLDLKISITLLIISLVIGLATWAFSRKWKLGFVVFSILGNLSFLISIESRMFYIYHLVWLKYVTIFAWPLINIILIINYRKQKNENKSN